MAKEKYAAQNAALLSAKMSWELRLAAGALPSASVAEPARRPPRSSSPRTHLHQRPRRVRRRRPPWHQRRVLKERRRLKLRTRRGRAEQGTGGRAKDAKGSARPAAAHHASKSAPLSPAAHSRLRMLPPALSPAALLSAQPLSPRVVVRLDARLSQRALQVRPRRFKRRKQLLFRLQLNAPCERCHQ